MNNTDCTHDWAHNTDKHEQGQTNNMRFNGMALYSYSTVIANKFPDKMTIVIANDGIKNSTTTAKHKRQAGHAIPPGWNIIDVDLPPHSSSPRPGGLLLDLKGLRICHDYMKANLTCQAKIYHNAKNRVSKINRWGVYEEYIQQVNMLGELLSRKGITHADMGITAGGLEGIAVMAAQKKEDDTRRRKAKAAKQLLEEHGYAISWRQGKPLPGRINWEGTYLRIDEDGQNVETSRGVVVPLRDALGLFKVATTVRRMDRMRYNLWSRDRTAYSVAGYLLHSIDLNGDCVVGCHKLTYEEMKLCFEDAVKRGLLPTNKEEEIK